MADKPISKTRRISTFIATIIAGFFLFALPNLFFGITKINGGIKGVNLLIIALFQFISVTALIHVSLKSLKKDFRYIGLSFENWGRDGALGLLVGLTWAAIQFGLIIPNTGGPERSDIAQELQMFDGSLLGLISFIALGVIGGGITEEIYNRGYFINVLKGFFKNEKTGLWIASILAIFFLLPVIYHLPLCFG